MHQGDAALGLEVDDFLVNLGFGVEEVVKILKNRSPYISFQRTDEIMALGCQTQVVFQFAVPEAGRSS